MQAQIVSFKCLLKNATGQVISSSFNRDVLTGSLKSEWPLKGLSDGLKDLKKGDRRRISLKAEEAYGFYDPKKVILFPRNKIQEPESLKVGQIVSVVSKSGKRNTYQVMTLHRDLVSLDGNHPLAGQDLIFEIEAIEAREATQEELEDNQNSLSSQWVH